MATNASSSHEDPSWTDADMEAHLAALLAEPRSLIDADPNALTAEGRVEQLVQINREQARLAALEAQVLAATAGPHRRLRRVTVVDEENQRKVDVEIVDEIREEIAAALRLSPGQVYDRIVVARLLAGALPATADALARGDVNAQHARALAEQTRRLDGFAQFIRQDSGVDSPDEARGRQAFLASCAELERRVLPIAARATPGRTRAAARRAVASIDAGGEERRRRQARLSVDVHVSPMDDGLALLEAWLPAADAARVHAALDAQAQAAADEAMATIGQRRAAALVAAVCGDAGASGVTAEIHVTIDLASLVAMDEQPATVSSGTGPAHMTTAQAVRDLLADPAIPVSLRRMLTDPVTGSLLDRGRRSYAVTGPLRAYLAARDATCRFPGCWRPAGRSQVDHAVAWSEGGRTDRDNLGHLCTRHHQLKTHGGWAIEASREDGSCRWRSPGGRRYDVDPPPV